MVTQAPHSKVKESNVTPRVHDCLIVRTGRRCGDAAVLFVGHVSTVAEAVTDPLCWDTEAQVGTLELVIKTRYQHCSHNTCTLSTMLVDHCTSQEAQLSPSDRAMRLVISNLANYHATVQKLVIRQVLAKPMV